jgi:hypothetical protein
MASKGFNAAAEPATKNSVFREIRACENSIVLKQGGGGNGHYKPESSLEIKSSSIGRNGAP